MTRLRRMELPLVTANVAGLSRSAGVAAILATSLYCISSATGAEERRESEAVKAAADRANQTAKRTAAPPVKWPKVIRGFVTDEKWKPVAGAVVRFEIDRIQEFPIGRLDELVYSHEMETDANGMFEFDSSKFPKLAHRPFFLRLSCSAPGFAEDRWWSWYSKRDTKVNQHLTDFKLKAGRLIRGKCVDPDGNPVPGAVLKFTGDYEYENDITNSMAWEPRVTDERGEFEVSVPRESKAAIEMVVAHAKWAPKRERLPKSGERFEDEIVLEPGSVVSGTVVDEVGKPIQGVVVVAESIDDGDLKNISFAAKLAVKTDERGQYQLPPLEGMYKIYLAHAAETDHRLGQEHFLVSDSAPPIVLPKSVLAEDGVPKTINFKSAPPLTVAGTIRWADGTPAEGCEVRASYLPRSFNTGIWIGQTWTDANGHYEMQLPNPANSLTIAVNGHRDANGKWHVAYPTEHVKADRVEESQHVGFDLLDEDRDDLDWELRQ